MSGPVAIITGAAANSGAGIARCYARRGMRVVVIDIDAEGATRVAAEIGAVLAVRCDVADPADVARAVARVVEATGRIDYLINCAGPYYSQDPLAEWSRSIAVNLLGTVHMTQAVLTTMQRQRSGSIVNIASDSGLGFGPEYQPAYGAAKAGIMRFTAVLRFLQQTHGIRVNCLTPDWIGTFAVRRLLASMTVEERRDCRAPQLLISEEQFANAVYELSQRVDYAGRVVLCWSGRPLETIVYGDPGYRDVEPY